MGAPDYPERGRIVEEQRRFEKAFWDEHFIPTAHGSAEYPQHGSFRIFLYSGARA